MPEEIIAQTQSQVNNIREREKIHEELDAISTEVAPVLQDIKTIVNDNLKDQANLNDIYDYTKEQKQDSKEQFLALEKKLKKQDEKIDKILKALES
jgi:chromosome segregation ATPase